MDSLDYNEILGATNDRADIDGDGIPGTVADKSKLEEYLTGQINYLPGEWNKLQTPEERISWIEKVIAVQDMWPYINGDPPWNQEPPYWVCADYINQMEIDFYGISNIDEFITEGIESGGVEYNPEHNARFNLPFYHIQTLNNNGVSHGAGGFFIGDGDSDSTNVLNFDDWYFVNYYEDDRLIPGEFDMNENAYANVAKNFYAPRLRGPPGDYFDSAVDLVMFDLNNGEGTMVGYKDSIQIVVGEEDIPFVILDNPNDDAVHVSQLENLVVGAGGFPSNTNFSVEKLDSLGYNSIPDVTVENTPLIPTTEYVYSDTTNLGGDSYSFNVTTKGEVESGGMTAVDSSTYKVTVDFTVGVDEESDAGIKKFQMEQNYPNPFNPETKIEFQIPQSAFVNLTIYNSLGQQIDALINSNLNAGNYTADFNAENLPSGIYFYKISAVSKAGNFTAVKKMVLLK